MFLWHLWKVCCCVSCLWMKISIHFFEWRNYFESRFLQVSFVNFPTKNCGNNSNKKESQKWKLGKEKGKSILKMQDSVKSQYFVKGCLGILSSQSSWEFFILLNDIYFIFQIYFIQIRVEKGISNCWKGIYKVSLRKFLHIQLFWLLLLQFSRQKKKKLNIPKFLIFSLLIFVCLYICFYSNGSGLFAVIFYN